MSGRDEHFETGCQEYSTAHRTAPLPNLSVPTRCVQVNPMAVEAQTPALPVDGGMTSGPLRSFLELSVLSLKLG